MGNKKSLTYLISKYAILELIYTFLIIVLFYIGLNILINNKMLYPANYAEVESDVIEDKIMSGELSYENIPFYYDYLYLENGEVVKNTIDKKYDDKIKEALKNGRAGGSGIIGTNIFKYTIKGNKQLILKYKISVIPVSERFYKLFENFELVYIFIMLIIWFLGFVLLLIHSSNLLKNEIYKIAVANDNINKMDLDYKRDCSKYKEIDGVLSSIDVLAKNLKNSLNEKWDMQIEQKEMLEQVTHDIRTPITLIKGNIELLKEENPDLLSERFSDISNGMIRLESYVEKLKNFSYTIESKKEVVSDEIILYWIKIISSICRTGGFDLSVIKKQSSNICLDKEAIAVALQNIITNSIENCEKGSTVYAEFIDFKDEFVIVIRDEGDGFDEELLPLLTEKFISSKVNDKDCKHGLGLSIVKKIVENNDGKLYLKNYNGAEVKMVFSKNDLGK